MCSFAGLEACRLSVELRRPVLDACAVNQEHWPAGDIRCCPSLHERCEMASDPSVFYEGGCTCRAVRYRMTSRPMFVHCCHCRWCQRETGASFALNAMIEADRVELLQGEIEAIVTPTLSGKGQKIF